MAAAPAEQHLESLQALQVPDVYHLPHYVGADPLTHLSPDSFPDGPEWSSTNYALAAIPSGFVVNARLSTTGINFTLHHYVSTGSEGPSISQYDLNEYNYRIEPEWGGRELVHHDLVDIPLELPGTGESQRSELYVVLPGSTDDYVPREYGVEEGQDVRFITGPVALSNSAFAQGGNRKPSTAEAVTLLTRVCPDAATALELMTRLGDLSGLRPADRGQLEQTGRQRLAELEEATTAWQEIQEQWGLGNTNPIARWLSSLVRSAIDTARGKS